MTEEIPDTETIKAFNETIIDEFRANGGKARGQFAGANLLLLTTTGAKSGEPRLSPLAYLRIDDKLVITAAAPGFRRVPSEDNSGDPAFRAAAGELAPQRGALRSDRPAQPITGGSHCRSAVVELRCRSAARVG